MTFLNVPYNILTLLILIKLKVYVKKETEDYRNGFRHEKSTINAICVVKQIIEKC